MKKNDIIIIRWITKEDMLKLEGLGFDGLKDVKELGNGVWEKGYMLFDALKTKKMVFIHVDYGDAYESCSI